MFNKLPMYQNVGDSAYKKDLSNITLICEHLNNPQNNFKSIHVGGTNGKGSCSHMLSSILQEAGYKVGLYTSPHLVDFRERVRINGEMISKDSVSEFMLHNFDFFESNNFSFFEFKRPFNNDVCLLRDLDYVFGTCRLHPAGHINSLTCL